MPEGPKRPPPRTRQLTALAVVLTASGCVSSDGPNSWTGTIVDSAGVSLVSNPQEALWRPGEEWRLEEEVRIGLLDGDPDYQFGQLAGLAVNSRDEILVVDRRSQDVRVFGPTGELARRIGGPGEGPGEFGRGVSEVLVGSGDTILVPDIQNRRMNRFTAEGAILGTTPFPPGGARPLRFDQNSASGAMTVQLRAVGASAADSTAPLDALREILTSGELGIVRAELPPGGLFEGQGLTYFTPEPMWDVSNQGAVVAAINDDYRFFFHDEGGGIQRVVSKSFTPRLITERDIGAFFAYLDREWRAMGVSPAQIARNHAGISFAEYFPAFSEFHIGYEGTLWVQPVQVPGDLTDEEIERYNFVEQFGKTGWEVFDREGRFLGIVQMPPRFQPRVFKGDAIYGVLRDEFDVQYVVRMRLRTG